MNIQLRGTDGFTVWFKVKRYATLGKVMETYARQVGTSTSRLDFVFEGQRIYHSHTTDAVSLCNLVVRSMALTVLGSLRWKLVILLMCCL